MDNLGFQVSKRELYQLFGKVGPVEEVFIVNRVKDRGKALAFVRFVNYEEASLAIRKLHRQVLHSSQLILNLARSDMPPDQRKDYKKAKVKESLAQRRISMRMKLQGEGRETEVHIESMTMRIIQGVEVKIIN